MLNVPTCREPDVLDRVQISWVGAWLLFLFVSYPTGTGVVGGP